MNTNSSKWQPHILWFAILLLGVGLLASLMLWDRADDESNLSADEVLTSVSNRYRLFESATKKFEKSTTSISHLSAVKAAQTKLHNERDKALVRYLQETVDRSLSQSTENLGSFTRQDNRASYDGKDYSPLSLEYRSGSSLTDFTNEVQFNRSLLSPDPTISLDASSEQLDWGYHEPPKITIRAPQTPEIPLEVLK